MQLEYTQMACAFKIEGKCSALRETNCVNCKFGKTKQQYIAENDAAIKRCRKLGRCEGCKYVKEPCRLSTEPKVRTPIGGLWW